jgi:serine/threonine protein kinase
MMEIAVAVFPYPTHMFGTHFDLLPYIVEEPSPTLPALFSSEFKTFVNQCLLKDHTKRPNATELLVRFV